MRKRISVPWNDEANSQGLNSLVRGAGGSVARRPARGTRFWSASDALSRQPFHGFPGGEAGWRSWRQTGQLPTNPLTGTPYEMSSQQLDHYTKLSPEATNNDPLTLLAQPTVPTAPLLVEPIKNFGPPPVTVVDHIPQPSPFTLNPYRNLGMPRPR